MKIGAYYLDDRNCRFTVWAPKAEKVSLNLISPQKRTIPMERDKEGYWTVTLPREEIEADTLYGYGIDESNILADPASQFQPKGVHGPSQVVNQDFTWSDEAWTGQALEKMIMYELHIGTFTPEGTLEAIIPRLADLKSLGINAIELMPIAQFPGDNNIVPELQYRNWGYDGVYLFAVQNSYGGPRGLKEFVNACHLQGISVILDVVYNHFGPEGCYVNQFAPYFSTKYNAEWGDAMNFDDSYSYGVRNFYIQNALFWLEEYHIDALRLDAVQTIYDSSAKHILKEIAENVSTAFAGSYKRYLVAESDLNDVKIIRPSELGGYDLDGQWDDDFHHALYTLSTGEQQGYYEDFGKAEDLAKAYRDTFVYDGKYAPHRKRYHGGPVMDRSPNQFVVSIQNHDQVANSLPGDRLSKRTSFENLKLAAGATILSPYIPLLFMGEEYGEEVLFTYFVSHSDPNLIESVRQGRKKTFIDLHILEEAPDPEAVETFQMCKLQWDKRLEGKHQVIWNFYKTLIQIRQELPTINDEVSASSINQVHPARKQIQAYSDESKKLVWWLRWDDAQKVICLMNFSEEKNTVDPNILTSGTWRKVINSADEKWLGQNSLIPEILTTESEIVLSPQSFALYKQE